PVGAAGDGGRGGGVRLRLLAGLHQPGARAADHRPAGPQAVVVAALAAAAGRPAPPARDRAARGRGAPAGRAARPGPRGWASPPPRRGGAGTGGGPAPATAPGSELTPPAPVLVLPGRLSMTEGPPRAPVVAASGPLASPQPSRLRLRAAGWVREGQY